MQTARSSKWSDLSVRFVSRDLDVSVVNGVSFTLEAGQALCILGKSGSGKSVTLRALMRLLPPTAQWAGTIRIGGIDGCTLCRRTTCGAFCGRLVSMIFQEPMTALDPVFTVSTPDRQVGRLS